MYRDTVKRLASYGMFLLCFSYYLGMTKVTLALHREQKVLKITISSYFIVVRTKLSVIQ